jgi:Arylsulfotransferase (ASST)
MTTVRGVVLILFAVATLGSVASAAPRIYPTGTTIYRPDRADNCYVVFGSLDGKTRVIDMDGNEVHRWDKGGFPSEILDPAVTGGQKGHLLVQLANGKFSSQIFANRRIGELDWNGTLLWQWGAQAPGGAARQNHDWSRLPDGNTLIIASVQHVVPRISPKPIDDQRIEEIAPGGDIVWQWTAGDHLGELGLTREGVDLLGKAFANGSSGFGFLTINDMQPLGPNKWFNAGDVRFNPENIMIDSREASFIAIIDKESGKIVWRMGPNYIGGTAGEGKGFFRPELRLKVPRPFDRTSGQHDAHLIPEGLPGAGNLLVFDNEGASGYPPIRLAEMQGSRVLEIDPIEEEIVWQYTSIDSDGPVWDFFSSFISSARRLPNGNTLIDEGMNGRFFQVTPKGEIVWEYVNPYFGTLDIGGRMVSTNMVYRAQPVPYDWLPAGLPHEEKPVKPVDISTFRVPMAP